MRRCKNALAPCIISRLLQFERSLRESMVDPIRWRGTYLLEASIHDSDLLAGELGLSQKFLYRHRPGGLLPCPRALELEERLFRSRRVRGRCHDLWSCRRLNCRKPATSCPLPPSSFLLFFFYIRWPARTPRGHTIAGTFPVIVRLIMRFLYRSAAASRSTSSPRDLRVRQRRRRETPFRAGKLQNMHFPRDILAAPCKRTARRNACDAFSW